VSDCESVLNYHFENPALLKAALTHTSGADCRAASNERMEFLGDSVLGLVTCEALHARFPDFQEGDLTKVKSVVVSRKTCSQFSRALGLHRFLVLGKGLSNNNEVPANILADVFEALVAAIFLDGGYAAAKSFVLRMIAPEIEAVAADAVGNNAKSQLQTHAQRHHAETPRYVVLDEQGPDHDKCFKVAAEIAGRRFVAVWGRNKKDAELLAAKNAMAELLGQAIPHDPDAEAR